MIRVSFNDGWEFRRKVSSFAELGGASLPYRPVTLPHDAMIGQQRDAQDGRAVTDGGAGAYFPGGVFEYRKVFSVPEQYRGSRILLEFEGVYRDAMVYVNGDYAGQRPYGYSLFRVDASRFLRFGEDNEIRVEARAHKVSRWYTGAGIYRDTWLLTGGPVRIGPDGVRVTTPDMDADLAYVALTLTDAAGTCYTQADRPVTVEVSGPGVLLGFGSAAPSTEEQFDATERRTYDGRALAVLRPNGPGKIRLLASAAECEPTEVLVTVE